MRRLKLGIITSFAIVAGAGMAVVANVPAAAQLPASCPNTWCGPGDTVCKEVANWACFLDGGCSGALRCSTD